MSDRHLTRDLLWDVVEGLREPSDLVPITLAHLLTLCPRCHGELAAFNAEAESVGLEIRPGWSALDSLRREGIEPPELDAPDRQAEQLEAELVAMLPEYRTAAVTSQSHRFRGEPLAERLLERSFASLPSDAASALEWAHLVATVISASPTSEMLHELAVRVLAYCANAHKAQGHLAQADEGFFNARFLLRFGPEPSRLLRAELDAMEGSLRRAQRRFSEAMSLLGRAVMVYRTTGERSLAIRALLTLGMTHREEGELARALEVTREALDLLGPAREDPRLWLMAWHNLALYLCETGEYFEAREALHGHDAIYELYPDAWTRLRHRWLEAKITAGEGDTARAEEFFRGVRQGFLAEEHAYDAALVTLELALLLLEQGRTAEVQSLAEEMVPVFRRLDVHREATAAWLLFRDAARAEKATAQLLQRLTTYLARARQDPSLTFANG